MVSVAQQLHEELFAEALTSPSNQPTYQAEPEILRRYGERAIDVLKSHDAEVRPLIRKLSLETSNAEPYDRNMKVIIGDTPTVYGLRLGFVKKGGFIMPVLHRIPIGKVFGSYNKDTDTLTVHYGIFNEFAADDPERASLENMGIEYQSPKTVLTHERAHRLQHENGALDKYNWRDAIEGLATVATEYLLKKPQQVYQSAQGLARNLIEKFGFKNTFRGDIPPAYRAAPNPVPLN